MEPFTLIKKAIAKANVVVPIIMGTDIAASSFYEKGKYLIDGNKYDVDELIQVYDQLHTEFPLLQMVEDPYQEEDRGSFAGYHREYPGLIVIGDDLTTTNKERLQKAIETNAINGIIIKPNQIGTLTDTLDTMSLAYENKIWCIVSHRSGETMDDFIADLAFGTKCYGFKSGAPLMKERDVKYQRLITIEQSQHD